MTGVKTPKVSRSIMRKSLKLLNMEYKPSELADELGVTSKTVLTAYLPAGLPYRRDKQGHCWIVGIDARSWLEQMTRKRESEAVTLVLPDDGFCVKCGKITIQNITKRKAGRAGMMKGSCPICGATVHRFIKLSEVTQ